MTPNKMIPVAVLILNILFPITMFGQSNSKLLDGATIEVFHPEINKIIDPFVMVELLADGIQWTEDPLRNYEENYLLFSDPRLNTKYKWS